MEGMGLYGRMWTGLDGIGWDRDWTDTPPYLIDDDGVVGTMKRV